jgi:hypothetical protein
MVILAGGRSGTLGEFAIAYDEAKVIGVLTGTGGIADRIQHIVSFVNKDTGAEIVYSSDPNTLLDGLMEIYQRRILPQYKTIIANRNEHGELER